MAPIANLTVRVSAQIAEFQKSFNDASKTAKDFANDFEGIATRAATVGAFFGTIAADIAGSVARGLGNALRDALKFSSEFSNAFLGLGSVARHFGADTELAAKAARSLSSDGLLPLKDSATGLKNLLAAGFNLPEATKLMGAFKDSAAFGRQGALSFGDAVRTATEGIKNGNSILVDNAGITKNLSQILKEAGFSAQDLSKVQSDAAVRLALYNGILKESAAFTGDAAKLTQTYTGQVTRLESAYNNTLATIGTVITQNDAVAKGIGFISNAFIGLNSKLSDNRTGFNLVSDAVIGLVGVLSGTVKAFDTVQSAFNTIDTAIVTFTSHVLEGVKTLADTLINLLKIASKIPGSSLAIAGMADEIVGLFAVSAGAGKELQTLADRIKDNEDRSSRWHSALSGVSGQLDALKSSMQSSKGTTVELGKASEKTGTQLAAGLGAGSKKAADEAKKLADQLQSTRDDIFDMDRKIGGFGEAFAGKIDDLVKRINGVPLIEKGEEWAAALKVPGTAAMVLADDALKKELGGVLDQLLTKFGDLKSIGLDALNSIAIATTKLPEIVPLTQLPGISLDKPSGKLDPFPKTFWEQAFNPKDIGLALGNAITSAIQGGGNVFAAAAGALGTTFTTGLAKHLTGAIAEGGKAISGFLGGAINAVLPGLGALLGPLVSKITSAIGGLFNSEGKKTNNLRDDFLAQFGGGGTGLDSGFGRLAAQLHEIGAEGDALFQRLIRADKVNDFRTALDLVTAALEKQRDAQSAVGDAADTASAAQQAAADALKARLDQLGAEFDSLNDAVSKEAPEEEMGAIERVQRERMAAIKEEKTAIQAQIDEELKARTENQKRVESETRDSHDRLQDYFNDNAFDVPYRYKPLNDIPGGSGLNVPALATGGIVRQPTLALVGEKGPEAVVPLSQFGRTGGGGDINVTLMMPDGEVLLRQMVKARRGLGL